MPNATWHYSRELGGYCRRARKGVFLYVSETFPRWKAYARDPRNGWPVRTLASGDRWTTLNQAMADADAWAACETTSPIGMLR